MQGHAQNESVLCHIEAEDGSILALEVKSANAAGTV